MTKTSVLSGWSHASNDHVLEFINLYRREKVLWDPKHPQCRNRNEYSEAWLRIQSSFSLSGCSIKNLKKKKESLMTSFRLHCNRKKKNPHYYPSWFAYPHMEAFLGEIYSSDKTNESENELSYTSENYTEDPISNHNVTMVPEKKIRQRSPKLQRKELKIDPVPQENITLSPRPVPYSNNTTESSRQLDEYDLYGQLLATKLRKLDEHNRDMAMHEIDNIMFRAKMEGESKKKYPATSTPVTHKMKSPIFIVTQQNNVEYEEHDEEEHIV